MKKKNELTWDDIKEMFAETSRQFKETDLRLAKMSEEWDKKKDREFEKWNQKKDQEFEEWTKKKAQESEEWNQRFKELAKLVGGIGNSNGDVAEELFYNALQRDRTFVNEKFDRIIRSMHRREDDEMECDIFLFNGKSAAIIEVKYNAKHENVSVKNLISRVERFRALYPEYRNHNIYLGVAALAFNGSLVKELHGVGIATIRSVGKKMVRYDKKVKAF